MQQKIQFSDEELGEVFTYLDELRVSGVTNMWGAGPFVERREGWGEDKASKALTTWIEVYDRNKPLDKMVKEAQVLLANEAP